MKKLIVMLLFTCAYVYAQDSSFVKISSMGTESYIYVADESLLDEYLDENFNTEDADFSTDIISEKDTNDDYLFESENLIRLKGKYRNKIWRIETKHYKKLKKVKASKYKKYKKK